MARNDEDVKRDIIEQLHWDSRIDASKVNVTVEQGRVTLTGEVPTYGGRTIARSAARAIVGVQDLEEHLTVRYDSPPPLPSDEEMRSAIVSILRWDPALDESHISVSVTGGVVSLEGAVDALWKKSFIESKLNGVRGLMKLENRLTVVPTQAIGDEVIAADVMAALKRNSLIRSEEVTVEVDTGIVTLTGTVPVWPAVDAANDDAAHTLGVKEVRNQLKVVGPGRQGSGEEGGRDVVGG